MFPLDGSVELPTLIICFAGVTVPPVAEPLHDVPDGRAKVKLLVPAVDALLFRL
jgi:hypothetical protein